MKIIESLYDTSLSEHGVYAKDVLDEIIPKLKENSHYFKSKGSIFSIAPSNKYIWTMKINIKPFYVLLCKYKYSYWMLPDLEMKLIECFRLKNDIEKYFYDKMEGIISKVTI
ncbi:hypothetical protein DFR86_01470 [Acidianus sulfidivorans JP7]|uniref:Uncharacterized protein n=1 Tax=Acidianus sulfidivorans JP7 TaxID=619593 RepID=A0A2U9IK32_9CREN|nr:hypothetical protein [Acidianus sulfidivorans]AWR96345.1 hypothetical protein DFR86_01470 [Acidianus sulfidivorans JP7]